jgi:non-homologous end joining protein Ku
MTWDLVDLVLSTRQDTTEGSTMPKPAAKDVVLQFFGSLVSITVDLMPTVDAGTKAKATSFKMVCPDHGEAVPVQQSYVCTDDPQHGPYLPGDCHKAREISKGQLAKVTPEEIAAAKASDDSEAKVLPIGIFDAASVERHTRPTGAVYRVQSQRQADVVSAFTDMVSQSPDKAFVGKMVTRGAEKVYRLSVWRGELVAQELARPEDVLPAQDGHVDYNPKLLDQLRMMADSQVEDFDPADYADTVRLRIAELDEARRTGEAPILTAGAAGPKAAPSDDLTSVLEAALAAAQGSKKGGKKGKGGKAA